MHLYKTIWSLDIPLFKGFCCIWRFYTVHCSTSREKAKEVPGCCVELLQMYHSFCSSGSWERKWFCFMSLRITCCITPNKGGQIPRWHCEHLPSDTAPLELAVLPLIKYRHADRGKCRLCSADLLASLGTLVHTVSSTSCCSGVDPGGTMSYSVWFCLARQRWPRVWITNSIKIP